ncbi:hypothetical protein [Legionella santicrucis]|uniref:hypothetical protein n=1 Tax=Legionella santicrucis TaxID=45074 RepID=UPI000B2A04F7|nr:hypothetical protein [Legionella santicrucis]
MPFMSHSLISNDDDIVNMVFCLARQYNFQGVSIGERFSRSFGDGGGDERKI